MRRPPFSWIGWNVLLWLGLLFAMVASRVGVWVDCWISWSNYC